MHSIPLHPIYTIIYIIRVWVCAIILLYPAFIWGSTVGQWEDDLWEDDLWEDDLRGKNPPRIKNRSG